MLLDERRRIAVGQLLRSRAEASRLGSQRQVYAIASGKGGVGKSTVTANLAVALTQQGRRVGILDADVWGYSIPRLMGVRRPPVAVAGMMLPVPAHEVQLMSVGFFVEDDEPVLWRGPMLHKAIEQFTHDVAWGDLDVLLVDLPPGTGDVQMSLLEQLPDAAFVVVTTPQAAAVEVAARVGRMALDARLPVAGVVENMAAVACAMLRHHDRRLRQRRGSRARDSPRCTGARQHSARRRHPDRRRRRYAGRPVGPGVSGRPDVRQGRRRLAGGEAQPARSFTTAQRRLKSDQRTGESGTLRSQAEIEGRVRAEPDASRPLGDAL